MLLLATVVVAAFVGRSPFGLAQSTPEPTKATAIKLPDGTVVFWTKNPDEANPAIDGVMLSPQDYKNLVAQAEQARKAKPQAPSSVAIRGKIEMRGERLVAALTLTYSFRTTQPRTLLLLGCQRGVLVGAKAGTGKLPILNPPGDDGLTLIADSAGEQSLVLDVEVPVVGRGLKNELGFDLGLPRAAITTLRLDAAPAAGIKTVSLGTRVPDPAAAVPTKPNEVKRYTSSVESLLAKPVPLGATDIVELTWEPISPAVPSAPNLANADTELIVQVEESQIETVAKLRLRGALKEWPLQLPVGSEVTVERFAAAGVGPTTVPEPMPTVVRPSDPNKPVWLIRTPGDNPNAEWLVTATIRVQRPKPNEPKFRGPYPIGPFSVLVNAKQSGRVNVFTGPSVRLSFKPLPEFRRLDLPAAATEDHVALFAFTGLPAVPPNAKANVWMEIDARAAPTAIRSKASHDLKLTPGGWRLESTIRVVPPPRGELEQILVEMPAEWPTLEATPEDLVDSIHIVKDGSPRLMAIRFNAPQKSAFTLKLLSTRPSPPKVGAPDERESKLVMALPRLPQTDERESSLTAAVPEGFEVRGTIALWEAGQPSAATDPLTGTTPNRTAAINSIGGIFDRAIARVELAWQSYRPALICDNRVEVTLQPRQLLVQQVLRFRPTQDDRRPIRLRGPENLVGLQSVPALDPVGPGLWEFRSNTESGKEFSLNVAFALRLANPVADPTVQLLWPDSATRTESVLRLWGGATGRRVNKFEGDWRELPVEPSADRDSLPLLTLAASSPGAPLTFDLSSLGESGLPTVWIERAYARATLSETSVVIQEKLLLKRWLGASLEMELPRMDHLELWVEGKLVEALPKASGDGADEPWVLTVPLPDFKPNTAITVEVRYRYAGARERYRERSCIPPRIRGALYRAPLRWLLTTEVDSVAFIPSGDWEPEYRWAWRGFGFAPTAPDSPEDMDAWLKTGQDAPDTSPWQSAISDSVAGRQTSPRGIPVVLIPRLAWVVAWSGVLLLLGLAASQLRLIWCCLGLAPVGIALACASAVCPQGLAQVLAAMQPGAVLLAFALATLFAWRFYRARRLERLPGFSRDRNAVPVRSDTIPLSNVTNGNRPSRSPSSAPPFIEAGSTVPPLPIGG